MGEEFDRLLESKEIRLEHSSAADWSMGPAHSKTLCPPLTLLVAGSWLPLLVARGGCLGPPLDISGSYRSIFKIQTAFVSPQHDLHF